MSGQIFESGGDARKWLKTLPDSIQIASAQMVSAIIQENPEQRWKLLSFHYENILIDQRSITTKRSSTRSYPTQVRVSFQIEKVRLRVWPFSFSEKDFQVWFYSGCFCDGKFQILKNENLKQQLEQVRHESSQPLTKIFGQLEEMRGEIKENTELVNKFVAENHNIFFQPRKKR